LCNKTLEAQRKLAISRRLLVIKCDQCTAYDCFHDEANNDTHDDNEQQDLSSVDLTDLIESLASCLPTGQYWNNEQLYINAMCSPYGDGVELAVFLDNKCTVYTNQAKFQSVYANYVYENGLDNLLSYVEPYIKSAFEEVMTCEDVEYKIAEEATDDAENGYVNEYCQQIISNGALDFNQCYSEDYNFGSKNNQDEEYEWYSYDMTYDEANYLEDVCIVVYHMSGEYTYSYDEEGSGTWYERDTSGSIKPEKTRLEFSSVAIGLLFFVGAGIVALSAFCKYKKRKVKRMEPLYQGGAMI